MSIVPRLWHNCLNSNCVSISPDQNNSNPNCYRSSLLNITTYSQTQLKEFSATLALPGRQQPANDRPVKTRNPSTYKNDCRLYLSMSWSMRMDVSIIMLCRAHKHVKCELINNVNDRPFKTLNPFMNILCYTYLWVDPCERMFPSLWYAELIDMWPSNHHHHHHHHHHRNRNNQSSHTYVIILSGVHL